VGSARRGRAAPGAHGLAGGLPPKARLTVVARDDETGGERRFRVIARLDGPIDVDYYRQGGILPAVVRRLAGDAGGAWA